MHLREPYSKYLSLTEKVVYFFWPETARLSLEEVAKNFGDEVAVHINDATDEEKKQLDKRLEEVDVVNRSDRESQDDATERKPSDAVDMESKAKA